MTPQAVVPDLGRWRCVACKQRRVEAQFRAFFKDGSAHSLCKPHLIAMAPRIRTYAPYFLDPSDLPMVGQKAATVEMVGMVSCQAVTAKKTRCRRPAVPAEILMAWVDYQRPRLAPYVGLYCLQHAEKLAGIV